MTITSIATTGIDATGLTKCFGSKPAVDGVDLRLDGGVIGLLGPNGAGKTTLLRMLATVLVPDAGSMRLLGHDPATADGRLSIRRQLGFLPQEAGLYQGFSAFDLVDYVAVLKEMTAREHRRDEVRRVLGIVGLTDDMHRKIRSLSGGTRRRVALATALLGDPPLLVLDEPAAGLDPEYRLRLRSVLSDAGRRGTVLLSTHHTGEAAAFCQQVVVLLAGRICFVGSPSELADIAAGRVWSDADSGLASPAPGSVQSWITPDGRARHLGDPPAGAELATPTIDDGYLLLTHEEARR